MATPISGVNGKILISATPITEIIKWEFNKSASTSRFCTSSSAGFKRTVLGSQHGSGTIDFLWDSAAVGVIKEFTVVTLLLYLDATDFYSVPAVISNHRVSVNIDTGEYNMCTSTFETNGAWAETLA